MILKNTMYISVNKYSSVYRILSVHPMASLNLYTKVKNDYLPLVLLNSSLDSVKLGNGVICALFPTEFFNCSGFENERTLL